MTNQHNSQVKENFYLSKTTTTTNVTKRDKKNILLNIVILLLTSLTIFASIKARNSIDPANIIYGVSLNIFLALNAIYQLYEIYQSLLTKVNYTIQRKD